MTTPVEEALFPSSPHRFDPTFFMPVRSIVRSRVLLDKRRSLHLVCVPSRSTCAFSFQAHNDHVANGRAKLAKQEVLGRAASHHSVSAYACALTLPLFSMAA